MSESNGDNDADPQDAFDVGDVVCLRSGSPWMTVVKVTPTEHLDVTTNWFCDSGEIHESFFPTRSLRMVTEDEKARRRMDFMEDEENDEDDGEAWKKGVPPGDY